MLSGNNRNGSGIGSAMESRILKYLPTINRVTLVMQWKITDGHEAKELDNSILISNVHWTELGSNGHHNNNNNEHDKKAFKHAFAPADVLLPSSPTALHLENTLPPSILVTDLETASQHSKTQDFRTIGELATLLRARQKKIVVHVCSIRIMSTQRRKKQ